MSTIHHQLLIKAPVARVYEAIATADGISTWWDRQTAVPTARGLVLEHNPGPEHGVVKLRVVEQVPNTRIEWECISTHPPSSPASAWTGTHFTFEMAAVHGEGRPGDDAATLDFRQTGYDDQSEFSRFNSIAWGQVLQNLKLVVERRPVMGIVPRITPCLWFDDQAEAAAEFYTGMFKNSRIVKIARYGEAGREVHGRPPGSVMTVAFELDGQAFTALNGGPIFKFNEAISLQINCETQEEVDHYWNKLSKGGDDTAQQCGWLKDKYGLSWQVVPRALVELISDPDPQKSGRVMEAMLKMKKIDIDQLKRAYAGS